MEDFFFCPLPSSSAYTTAVPQPMDIMVFNDQGLHNFSPFQSMNECVQTGKDIYYLSVLPTLALRFPHTPDPTYPLSSHICLGLRLCGISFPL
jgi:hypothetical protein